MPIVFRKYPKTHYQHCNAAPFKTKVLFIHGQQSGFIFKFFWNIDRLTVFLDPLSSKKHSNKPLSLYFQKPQWSKQQIKKFKHTVCRVVHNHTEKYNTKFNSTTNPPQKKFFGIFFIQQTPKGIFAKNHDLATSLLIQKFFQTTYQ